jgi:RimJ/RimL family protein N-acetyltransferase
MLIGARATIGALAPADLGPMYCWANDPEAARLNGAFRPVDLLAYKMWFDNIGKDASKVVFGIRRRNETVIIGFVEITNISSINQSAEIGIRIGSENDRNRGFGKEALGLALGYCWNHLNLRRVSLNVLGHNKRAIKVYQAAGFKKEGTLRRACFVDGRWIDVVLMARFRPARRSCRVVSTPRDSQATSGIIPAERSSIAA